MSNEDLAKMHNNFDFLAIHYGVYWGQYPAFEKISRRLAWIKNLTGKIVLSIGVPTKFAGQDKGDSRLMPIFGLISDGWVKNWRPARGSKSIRLTDMKDLRSKTYQQFLESGYLPNQLLEPTKKTVYEMFQEDSKDSRKEYEGYVLDSVMSDLRNITPETVESYVYNRFYNKYHSMIIGSYREKVIVLHFRESPVFESYTHEERNLLEVALRKNYSPAILMRVINTWKEIISRDQNTPVNELAAIAMNFSK